jgi:hypothetical protein
LSLIFEEESSEMFYKIQLLKIFPPMTRSSFVVPFLL